MAIIGTLPVTLQNGTIADASQVMSDLNFIVNQVNANAQPTGTISPGSLVNIQVFTASGTYTPTPGANKARIRAVGGGGAGGGSGNSAAGAAIGGGGSSGAYAEIYIPTGVSSQTVTIGAAGIAAAGANGGNGGITSFGAILSCPGGLGGNLGGTVTSFPFVTSASTTPTAAPTVTGATTIVSVPGMAGRGGEVVNSTTANPGAGGSNLLGAGGQGVVGVNPDASRGNGSGYGAAGAGYSSFANVVPQAGYAATPGILIIEEYA
jgi:hypothetical protein